MFNDIHTLFLLLGANLGNCFETLNLARQLITEQVGFIVRLSALYETAPWGVADQPAYLNQVLMVETKLGPEEVLTHTQAIEQQLGRVRLEKWGARLIDIDILYYDQLICQSDKLTIPHPYLHQRRFTLVPLAEIAPDWLHPNFKVKNTDLLGACPDGSEVKKLPLESQTVN